MAQQFKLRGDASQSPKNGAKLKLIIDYIFNSDLIGLNLLRMEQN